MATSASSYLYPPRLANLLSSPIPSVYPQPSHLQLRPPRIYLPSQIPLQLRRLYHHCHHLNLSLTQPSQPSQIRPPNSVGPTTSLHCLQHLFPLPFLFPVISAAFILGRLTLSERCANVIAAHIVSLETLENPEIEIHLFFLTLSPILSRKIFPLIHTPYLLFHLFVLQQNFVNLLLFTFPLFIFLPHLILIGTVTPVYLHLVLL